MGAEKNEKDSVIRVVSGLRDLATNTIVGILGVIATVFGLIANSPDAKNILLCISMLLLIIVTATYIWRYNRDERARNASSRQMSYPAYFELVRGPLERKLASEYDNIASGLLPLYGGKVREAPEILIPKLAELPSVDRHIRAVDLTTDPVLLSTRVAYLEANRTFIAAGGTVERVFVCEQQKLAEQEFCKRFLKVVEEHREIGVNCGLVVRDPLPPELAVDIIVFGPGAVMIEAEQGTADYARGRSEVWFMGVDRWIAKFESLWGPAGAPSATRRLQSYEMAARPMLGGGWEPERIIEVLAAR